MGVCVSCLIKANMFYVPQMFKKAFKQSNKMTRQRKDLSFTCFIESGQHLPGLSTIIEKNTHTRTPGKGVGYPAQFHFDTFSHPHVQYIFFPPDSHTVDAQLARVLPAAAACVYSKILLDYSMQGISPG